MPWDCCQEQTDVVGILNSVVFKIFNSVAYQMPQDCCQEQEDVEENGHTFQLHLPLLNLGEMLKL